MDTRTNKANRITLVGFFANLILVAFKLAAGILGHSAAMIADGVHSLSDFATDIVVLVSFRIVANPADKSHDYGHGKFETLATAIIGLALLAVGIGIFWNGAQKIWDSLTGHPLNSPSGIAFLAAMVSIITKEWLYQFTVRAGREINSQAVIANAWHHRSDAFSSIGTMAGIGGAIVLGENWRLLDPLAAVIVSVFILKVGISISFGSFRELTEESLDAATEEEVKAITNSIEGVIQPHNLRTRRIGNTIAVDLHIRVDGSLSTIAAHDIASKIEDYLRLRFGQQTHISIHVEPCKERDCSPSVQTPDRLPHGDAGKPDAGDVN